MKKQNSGKVTAVSRKVLSRILPILIAAFVLL